MAGTKNHPAWPLSLALAVLAILSLATGCELEEPRRPNFLPTPSPLPVYPPSPIDSGANDGLCAAVGEGLGDSIKSNLRYGTELTFRRGVQKLESARGLVNDLNDSELTASLEQLLGSIQREDASAAGDAADVIVRRCKQLGYGNYMAPAGFAVW